jgi:RNA polymerase sigma factor (sigma-70 family)
MQGMAGVAAQFPQAKVPAAALKILGDDRLVGLVASGDSRAFEAIYERHHQALYRYCRSIVGNPEDAADALQSTMASALRGLSGEQREIDLRPWLFRIAHNESVSLLRKRRPQVAIEDAALELEAPAHDPAIKQRLNELVADLRELPDNQRGALVMHELSGLPYREIASALGTTEPHARQLVYEARSALYDIAEGRAMECDVVRRTISDGDRRVLRGRRIRSHLRTCDGCAGFEQLIRTRKRDLAAIAPPLPAALAAGLLHKILGGGGSAGGTGAGIAATSSGGAGLSSAIAGKGLALSALSKLAVGAAITAVVGAGAVEVATNQHQSNQNAPNAGASAVRGGANLLQTKSIVAPAASGTPAAQNGAAPGSHGKSNVAPGHTKTGHSAHPVHPGHPTHPTHPAHPSHPAHPVTPGQQSHPAHPAKPTHPVQPTHPVKPTHPAQPTQPTHPTHPTTPAPTTNAPASTQPIVPPGHQTLPSSNGNDGNANGKVKDLVNALAP